jgi:phytoene dehydrogenase-like protein
MASNASYDCVIVGSGINSLVCAALLARAGKRVCVLERNDRLGGCIRTEELTVPGFAHDVMSTAHPLFMTSPGYAELADDLHANGLEYVNNDTPTAVVLPDNRSFIMRTSREENVRNMEALSAGDGQSYQASLALIEKNANLIFGLLSNELWSYATGKLLVSEFFRNGAIQTTAFFGEAMQNSRRWLEQGFKSDLVRAMLAPWVLHTGLGPESSMSALMNAVIAFTLEQVGMPLVKGGNDKTVEAMERVIRSNGGELLVNADVNGIVVQRGRATGVMTEGGQSFDARQAVVCNVTPTQLYRRLLVDADIPQEIRQQADQYRYGKGDMQIHLALDEPPDWGDPQLRDVVLGHLTPGLDGVSKAVSEADRGLLPETATIVVGQPTAVDPSRAPDGKWILWIQLQELPRVIKGDAAGKIAAPADGQWNETVREQYADRIVERLKQHISNLDGNILGRKVLSPADLEALNMNLVGGDPYSGECSLDQFFVWRPTRLTKNHTTPVKDLYHIGASTHPGPGLGGVSGYLVANKLR